MVSLEQKVESWKKALLDLGKRNRLLNYKDTKRSSLRILEPSLLQLWDHFVVREKPIEFPYYDDDQAETIEVSNQALIRSQKKPEWLKTNQSLKEQQKTLRNLRDKAKTVIEEQGFNVLYLSCGFLRWSEDPKSTQYFLSPIVLVPVTIKWESITSPFVLQLHEDEIVVNPTLAYMLENEFGIKMPEFDSDNKLDEYFDIIIKLIKNKKWDIVLESGLSLLSFLKLNMYRDLESNKNRVVSSPIVRALAGDTTALERIPEDAVGCDHDAVLTPSEVFQVVDADSSQQDAILLAKKGISFVLQGPPGTGKSQTITNIIAECLSEGKKILFVSEKAAALNVVHKRLTAAGFSRFCLPLHSHKANKKAVLAELSDVLDLARKKVVLSSEASDKLDRLSTFKKVLNEYAKDIHTVVNPLGSTIFQVNGVLAHLQNIEDILFTIDSIDTISRQHYQQLLDHLNQYTETMGNWSDEHRSNPWYDSTINNLTHELRQKIWAELPSLQTKIELLVSICKRIHLELKQECSPSCNKLTEILNTLFHVSKSPKIPIKWMEWDDSSFLWKEAQSATDFQRDFRRLQVTLSEAYAKLILTDKNIPFCNATILTSTSKVRSQISCFKKYICNDECFNVWQKDDLKKTQTLLDTAKTKANVYFMLCNKIQDLYENDIFDIDHKAMYQRFKTGYSSIIKYCRRSYWIDRQTIRGLRRNVTKQLLDSEMIELLLDLGAVATHKKWFLDNKETLSYHLISLYKQEHTDFTEVSKRLDSFRGIIDCQTKLNQMLEALQDLENHEDEFKQHFDFFYNNIETDWDIVRDALLWADEFRSLCKTCTISPDFISYACCDDDKIKLSRTLHRELLDGIDSFTPGVKWFFSLFHYGDQIKSLPLATLYENIGRCNEGLELLEKWIDYHSAREKCIASGLSDFIDKLESQRIESTFIVPIFKKRFYRLWLDSILPKFPSVYHFRRTNQMKRIEEFARLDKIQFDIAKARIYKKLIDSLPTFDDSSCAGDELGILKRELAKQRKLMPIRKLFREIPNLLPVLKPCMMMSPLSVSLFLEADNYQFDTVIFDEASQVRTEDAVGAIARGKQIIIVGDSKQLPPSNFFSAALSNDDFDYDEEEDSRDEAGAFESVLDEAGLLPDCPLLWHYRSRHEHLIAFSNAKIYKNKLITFPSNIDKAKDCGVEYIHVPNGIYDRGGKQGNMEEAKQVAYLVFEHFKKQPNRSLGVITFSLVQQNAIDTVLRQMRRDEPDFEIFFSEEGDEPFFLKNLENVQGDERDTILFSIGYAKDNTGRMLMNFGPLGKPGGERRLNVAITRAKHNVKLIGSISPTDIDVERINSDGPKLLKLYIDYAINGPSVIPRETTECDITQHDSPFEEAVYNFLDRKGYKLATQVGCSGYRVDMAVKHPSATNQYVLGIECDGASYHSARTARERDRLRQSILEDMGWKIYRIWSTDWIKDPVSEGIRLVSAISEAIGSNHQEEEREKETDRNNPENSDFLKLEPRNVKSDFSKNPYGFKRFKPVDLTLIRRDHDDTAYLGKLITALINSEYPMHYELLCKKVAPYLGKERASSSVRDAVDTVLTKIIRSDITKKNGFLYPASFTNIQVHLGNNRKIDHISTNEIAVAMLTIVEKSFGIQKDFLFQTTARIFDFNRIGPDILKSLETAFRTLKKNLQINETDGKVTIP